MDLPEDIRLKIEANTDKETILEVVNRLQSEGVVITGDIFAATQATLDRNRETPCSCAAIDPNDRKQPAHERMKSILQH